MSMTDVINLFGPATAADAPNDANIDRLTECLGAVRAWALADVDRRCREHIPTTAPGAGSSTGPRQS